MTPDRTAIAQENLQTFPIDVMSVSQPPISLRRPRRAGRIADHKSADLAALLAWNWSRRPWYQGTPPSLQSAIPAVLSGWLLLFDRLGIPIRPGRAYAVAQAPFRPACELTSVFMLNFQQYCFPHDAYTERRRRRYDKVCLLG
jgi:hypothetical protein